MDWLTAEDWEDLQSAGTSLLIVVGVVLAMTAIRRVLKGEPVIQIGDARTFLEYWGFILAIMLALPLSEVAERLTGSSVVGFIVMLVLFLSFIVPTLWMAQRRQAASASAHGVENPDGAPAMPHVPASKEENRVGRILLIGTIIIGGGLVAGALALTLWAVDPIIEGSGSQVDAGRLAFAAIGLLLILLLPVAALIGRWPGTVRSNGSIDIAASREQIWEKLAYCDGMEDWKGIYQRIERLAEPGEVYRLHNFNMEPCLECMLPKHPDQSEQSVRVEVLDAVKPSLYRTKSASKGMTADKGDAANWLDHEINTYRIEALPNGQSRVAFEISADRAKIWMALLIKLGGPVTQSLQVLKVHLEGGEDDSIYATGRARIAAARLAPRYCGCPPAGALVAA